MERYNVSVKIREANYAANYLAWDLVTQQTVTLRKIPYKKKVIIQQVLVQQKK